MTSRIGVIGAGPRGTSVLERLCANARGLGRAVEVHVFDPAPAGPGGVWRPQQSPLLLMNTVASQVGLFTDDSVRCEGPLVRGPGLHQWARMVCAGRVPGLPAPVLAEAFALGPDDYPTRAFYGHYLEWALRWLLANAPAEVTVRLHRAQVVALDDEAGGTQVVTLADGTRVGGFDRVVLALGHGPAVGSAEERADAAFARAHGLHHVRPGNPADVDLGGIRPGTPILLRGLGLCFFDYLVLLTAGRGGRFVDGPRGLVYRPSGQEPVLYAGSRRGVPHHARGRNQKGPHTRHTARFLTEAVIAELRAHADAGRPVGFADRVWPLLDREVRTVYHETLVRRAAGVRAAAEFARLAARAEEPEPVLLKRFGIARDARWDWAAVERPHTGRAFADADDFRRWLLDHLRADLAQARLGNVDGPVKAALDVLRDLRNEIRLVVDHGGVSGESYRDELEGWYNPLNAFLSIGPPAARIEEMIALIEAGVLHVLGPGTRVRRSTEDRAFLADSALVPGPPVAVRGLIEARLPEPDLRRSANPLLRHLRATGQARPYRIGGYECGALAVTGRPFHVVDARGRAHPARFAFGVPTEGVHWVTAAGIRPGVGSVTLEDADAIARALLGGTAAAPLSAPGGPAPKAAPEPARARPAPEEQIA
ncbi:FAD/NAD(P)-binding protein [Saccharothrix sp. NPDC042600]|uniref:FAD/NAD(P)-binding protein n=1 Tax=Saccharothrix TaxID=2071 RepID=UPI003407F47B|nr:FAD/NAD(P)-binding protein [Saccharothrix mutabilis subsp. capreolus]